MIKLLTLLGAAWAGPVPVGPSAAADAALQPRRVALLVGVQEYDDPALQGLQFPAKDAADLGRALGAPGIGGFDRVFVVSGHDATTRAALTRTIALVTADLQRDDTFLLYFSGHGTLTLDANEGSRLWFLPADASLDRPEARGLAVAEVEDLLAGLAPRRRVLIMDTCHNGRSGSKSSVSQPTAQLLSGFRGEVPAPRTTRDVAESEARLYAAQYFQPAMEDPELQNGVYTHFFIEALGSGQSRADLDGDTLVDVTEAHAYARDRTITYTGGLQVPRAEYSIVGREEIFLSGSPTTRSSAELALVSAYDQLLDRAKILINGTPRGELPGLYAVEPGRSLVEIQGPDGDVLVRRRVTLDAGERLPVEALMQAQAASLLVAPGVSYTFGDASFNALSGSLGLWWVRPWSAPTWLRPDVHTSLDLGYGPVSDSALAVTTGAANVGFTLALQRGALYGGPTADLRVPFRARADARAQTSLTPAAGLALGASTVKRSMVLDLRVDGSWSPRPYGDVTLQTWTTALHLGVARAP